jgi:hypothetical protein
MDDAVRVYNLTLPNVLFLLNTDDAPVCSHDMVQSRKVPGAAAAAELLLLLLVVVEGRQLLQ